VNSWVGYSILRVLFFAVPLAGLLLAGIEPWIAGLVSAVIAFCLSYVLLGRRRDELVADLAAKRAAPTVKADDELAEDRDIRPAAPAAESADDPASERDRRGESRAE
jgi:hypothetical protein